MIDKLRALEESSRKLELTPAEMLEFNEKMTSFAADFVESTETKKTFSTKEGNWDELKINHTNPQSLSTLLDNLNRNMVEPGLNPASGGHLGYIPGGGIVPAAWGDFLAAVTNRYAGVRFGGPGAVELENGLIDWLVKMFGYPEDSYGNLCSGGSIANLIAITTAKKHRDLKSRDIENAVIYLSAQTHHCVHKAIRIVGMEECVVREVALDDNFRIDAKVLEKLIIKDKQDGLSPFMVVASMGTTDTGAIDPITEIADICESQDLWFHVDAAYGGFFILTEELKDTFKGIDRSDSLVIDPHKGLFLPYGLGAVLTRHPKAMLDSHYYKASYMQDAIQSERSPADYSPELTKHFRGLRLWLPLKYFGLEPFVSGLSEKIWLCRYFYQEIQNHGFEVGPYPDMSVCIYRYVPPQQYDIDAFNKSLMKAVHEDGRTFISSTTIDGHIWIRLAVLSFRTHKVTIDKTIDMLNDGVKKLIG